VTQSGSAVRSNNNQSNESGGAASEKAKEAEGQIILCNPKKNGTGTYRCRRKSQCKIPRRRCRKQIQQDSSRKTNK
jgi:hypothetical protein